MDRQPFLPQEEQARRAYCRQIFQLQVTGLKQRLAGIGANAVVGLSGGLDSTLALLVTVEAMRQLGRPVTDVYGVTMPCFGTSQRTYQNSWELAPAGPPGYGCIRRDHALLRHIPENLPKLLGADAHPGHFQ